MYVLLEVEPPTPLLRLNVGGRRRAGADEVHSQSFGQSARDVPTARADRFAVGLLQGDHVCRRHPCAVRQNPCRLVYVAGDELRAPRGSAEAEPPQEAPADEV